MNVILQNNLKFEMKFNDQIKRILADYFIIKDIDTDLNGGSDFIVYSINPFRIGVRLRRNIYYQNKTYRYQFTIRYKLKSKHITEIDKIKTGLVDYILYGFVDKDEKKIIQYFIGDLKVFTKYQIEPYQIFTNKNRLSQGAVFRLQECPKDFVLKSYGFPETEFEWEGIVI